MNAVKIYFPADSKEWHGANGEWLWSSIEGRDRYKVENNPIYLYGISYHDIVSAITTPDGKLHFENIIEKSGHSLYRVILNEGVHKSAFLARWLKLDELGCSYESNSNPEHIFSIDVPPDVDVYAVYDVLSSGFEEGVWDFEEADFQHKLRDTKTS